jgi:putative transposase
MSDYRRLYKPGGTFFFTLVTENRAPILVEPTARRLLREAFAECRRLQPFDILAIVLLPDHLHTIWRLPDDDDDFSTRWARIKAHFTHALLPAGGAEQRRSVSQRRHRNRGVWQRRFWEHAIRDQDDLNAHFNYIHYNPIKHGLAKCAHEWPYSSFHRFVRDSAYPPHWQCHCDGRTPEPLNFLPLGDVE